MITTACSTALLAYWLCSATASSVESGALRPHVGWCNPVVGLLLDELSQLEAGKATSVLEMRMTAELPNATRSYYGALAHTFEPSQTGTALVQREVLLTVLASANPRDVIRLAEESVHVDSDARRCAALAAVGRLGHAGEVPLLFKAVDGESEPPSRSSLEVFERSLTEVLARDERAFASCRSLWSSGSEPVIEQVVGALGETGGDESLGLLLQILNRRVLPDETVLGRIARLAQSASLEQIQELEATLVDYLDEDLPMTCQIAAQALGRVSSANAIPDLIELLDAEHRGVRESALWALRRISSRSFRDDPARWHQWHEAELVWMDETAPRLLDQLASDEVAQIGSALRELASHPIFAYELVPLLELSLDHAEPQVRICTVRTLAKFASVVATPSLRYALEDWDEDVSAAAAKAIAELKG